MLIDWFTVGAQAINFLILVWLLKRFLYKPILDAIDAREKGIAAERADADAKKAEAQKERDEFQQKNQDFDRQRAALVKTATDEANTEGQRLLDDAKKETEALRAKRREALRNEQRNLSQAILRWTQTEVFAIARKSLADLATASLEERICEVFVKRLRGLTGAPKEQLSRALKTSSHPVPIRSAFELPPEQQKAIQQALNETFSADLHIQFETVPELVCGIELSANGQKVAWSIGEYLGTLEKSACELLHKEEKADEKPAPKPEAKAEVKSQPTKSATKPEPKGEAQPNPKP
jgi:F-type H+-transporting ATPase subunit b